jgi:peptidoglycan hydrolase CwlO-like protein
MSNDTVLAILVFISFNIVIYVALLRWASRIENIEKNLESIEAKLDELAGAIMKLKGEGDEAKAAGDSGDKDLH